MTVLSRPEKEEEAVAMCFYGLFRFSGTVERMWQRTKPNLEGIPNRNIFVSTWNYIQTSKSVGKIQRTKKRAWFQRGGPVEDMPRRLEAIFKGDLKGYYVGDYRGVSDICSSAACVVAIVRSNCLSAVHAFEQKKQAFHRYFMFQRIDRSLEIPMWFTPGCGKVARDNISMQQQQSVNRKEACHFQAGYCLSYFRKHYYLPIAELSDGRMTTHTFLCRWTNRQQATTSPVLNATHSRMTHMSDYAAIGTRDTIATLLVGVFEHLFRNLADGSWIAEALVAASATSHGISVKPVNMGYERKLSMGQPAVFAENSSSSSSSLPVQPPPTDTAAAGRSSSLLSENPVEDDSGTSSLRPHNSIEGTANNASELMVVGDDATMREEAVNAANITCGSLAPKYLLDTCDFTGRVSAPLWKRVPPVDLSRWAAAGKTCCHTMNNCLFGRKRKRK